MPVKNIFDRDKIINAAFEIVRKDGWSRLSARSLARELGASTMPLYSYLKSMEDLKKDLKEKTIDLLLEYQTKNTDKDHPFLDMGMGYLLFAKNEKNLFKFLYEENYNGLSMKGHIEDRKFNEILKVMKKDPDLKNFTAKELKDVLLKMWIFVHGLSFMMIYGGVNDMSDKEIKRLIVETGFAVISAIRNNFITIKQKIKLKQI